MSEEKGFMVKLFCHSCDGAGFIWEKEYEDEKTPKQAISIRIVCPECNGLGYIKMEKYKDVY